MSDHDILLLILACEGVRFAAWLVRAAWRACAEDPLRCDGSGVLPARRARP